MQKMWVQSLGQEDPHGGASSQTLQYSCLENPMNRGAWQAMVHRVTKSQTQLKQLSMHAGIHMMRKSERIVRVGIEKTEVTMKWWSEKYTIIRDI